MIHKIRSIHVISIKTGFTLIEAIVAVGILAGVVVVNLAVLDYSNNLSSLSNNISIASNIAQSRMETIRVMSYQDIKNTYTNAGALKTTIFATGNIGGGLTGSVVIIGQETILNSLIRMKVVVSFLDPKGRTIGEDTNLNGILDAGEDANTNGELDSICQMQTIIANSV